MARDYADIGNVLDDMGKSQEALESLNMALKIHEELNDRVGMARDYFNMSFVLPKTSKDEALKALDKAVAILQKLETENNYRHPLMEKVDIRISDLKG